MTSRVISDQSLEIRSKWICIEELLRVSRTVCDEGLGYFSFSSGMFGEVLGQENSVGLVHVNCRNNECRFGIPGKLKTFCMLSNYCMHRDESSNCIKTYRDHGLFTLESIEDMHSKQQ